MNSTRFIIKAVSARAQAACLIAAANCTVATAGEAVVQQERAGFLTRRNWSSHGPQT